MARVDGYRFGDGILELDVDDSAFRQRFRQAYQECAVSLPAPREASPRVRCSVRLVDVPQVALFSFNDSESLDLLDFSLRLFPERGFRELPSTVEGWRFLARTATCTEPFMVARDNQAFVDRRQPWRAFIGSCAVNRILRLQREVLFFHAASIGIDDVGILLTGPKGAGKSTISLMLASRGHCFLGDEIAAVRRGSGEMMPMRRAASIRSGPRARTLDVLLRDRKYELELFPDGTQRIRANVGDLFPNAVARPVQLHSILFLRRFAPHPCLEPFTFSLNHLRLLQPLSCTLWGVSPGLQLMEFLTLFSRVQCYFLDVGEPEATADLIEETAEGLWV